MNAHKDVWAYKIVALMHDPPYKPYITTGTCGFNGCSDVAKDILRVVLGDDIEIEDGIDDLIKVANYCAAGCG